MAKARSSDRASARQAWLLLGTAVAVTAMIALVLSAPAAVLRVELSAADTGLSSREALAWAIVAAMVTAALAVLLAVMLQAALLSRRRALALVARVTQSLREAEAVRRAVIDCSAEGVITVDAHNIVLGFNHAAERMFGFKAAEVIGQHIAMLVPARHRRHCEQPFAELMPLVWGGQAGLRREVTGLRRDGKEFSLMLALNAVELAGPRRFVGVLSDLTERRRAEQALRESEQRLRLMIASISDYAVLMLDAQGRVLHWSRGAERLNGCAADDIVGQHYAGLSREEVPGMRPALEQAAAAGRCENHGWRRRRDGSRFQAHEVITAVRDDDGRLLGYCAIAHDGAPKPGVPPDCLF